MNKHFACSNSRCFYRSFKAILSGWLVPVIVTLFSPLIASASVTATVTASRCEAVFDTQFLPPKTFSSYFLAGLRGEELWSISARVRDELIRPYSIFFQQFDYVPSANRSEAFLRPSKASQLNHSVESYNQKVPEEFNISIRFFDHPAGEMPALDYIRSWAKRKLPLDDGHDWLVHVPAHLPLPHELTEKSVYNMNQVLELIDNPLVAQHFFFRKALIDKFADSIENLYRPTLQNNAYTLQIEWQMFVIAPEYFDRVIRESLQFELSPSKRTPELLALIQQTRSKLFGVSMEDAIIYHQILQKKLAGQVEF